MRLVIPTPGKCWQFRFLYIFFFGSLHRVWDRQTSR